MKCAYCNKSCDDRPVRYEAVCWDCWAKAMREREARKQRRWWRRPAPTTNSAIDEDRGSE